MKKNGLEQATVILLFVMVLVVFSFAQRDTRKLDRLYKTTHLLQQNNQTQTVHKLPLPARTANN